jgi:hypothetical protein
MTNSMLAQIPTAIGAFISKAEATLLASISKAFGNSSTENNIQAQINQLKLWFRDSDPSNKVDGAVLVAHSQGNLFVNTAFDGFKASAPLAKLQVVHVAPASVSFRGEYVLADIDRVIKALGIDGFIIPNSNINLTESEKDISGHFFVETYLDSTRAASDRIKSMITSGLDKMIGS